MATVSLSTSPTTLDSGSSEFVTVANVGTVDVTLTRGAQSFTLRPTQGRTVYPEGTAVTAVTTSGTGSVTTTAQGARQTQAQQFAADPAFTGTYGQGSDQWLKQCAGSFSFVFTTLTTTDATTGLPTSAAVRWPDGITGAFTGTIDAGGNGYSGYVVTYAGMTTKTVTASGITYDATTGTALGPTSLAVA